MEPIQFQQLLLAWFDRHGRKDLPWQQDISPYRVWISEIMLQQTQVATVVPYFNRFADRFPSIDDLACASVDEVLRLWSGLGYYSRARNLHKTAQKIVDLGYFPDALPALMSLPGIGRSTAGAILSIAFQQSQPILDGNVKRVLSRFNGVSGWPGDAAVSNRLWQLSEHYLPEDRVADFTQAIMDLGATVCVRRKPNCSSCPLKTGCTAYLTDRVEQFPSPRPKSTKPVKQCVFLLLLNSDRQVLLEKRPAVGIWGGLWSLPEFDAVASANQWCVQQNLSIVSRELSAVRRHSFSHFHLDFQAAVFLCDRFGDNNIMEASSRVWYKVESDQTLALAAPIKLLLHEIIQQELRQDGKNNTLRQTGSGFGRL